MNGIQTAVQDILGLYELDLSGKISYCFAKNSRKYSLNSEFIGINFFQDIEIFACQDVFRLQFERFARSHESIENFKLCGFFQNETFKLRVLMVRVNDNKVHGEKQKTILIYVRED